MSAEIVAYRNHAHLASRLIYAEQYRDDAWVSTFGRRSTADAQIFYPIENGRVMLLPGDEVDVHCIYNTSMRDTQTGVGLAAKTHEMCNQYLMYTLPHDKLSAKDPFTCRFTENCKSRPRVSYLPTSLVSQIPSTYDTELPSDIGAVAGVASSENGDVYLFARRGNSFASRTMIVKDPIWKINGKANEVECSFGASTQFHVPHGLYMAPDGALWATDTSLHIAVKFSAQELQKCSDSESEVITSIEIGIRGVHGSDQHHLSAPTDVVVARHNGNVYVSDGYGNKRVAVFSSLGEYLFEFGTNVGFDIVHNVALDEDAERAFVADRNNGRLHYFSMLDGTYIGTIDPGIKGRPGYFGHICRPSRSTKTI